MSVEKESSVECAHAADMLGAQSTSALQRTRSADISRGVAHLRPQSAECVQIANGDSGGEFGRRGRWMS